MRKTAIGALALALVSSYAVADDVNTLKIEKLKKQLEEQQQQIDALADALEQQNTAGSGAEWFNKTTLGGYGEHHFNHFKNGTDEVDAHRFVLYIGHQFSDKVRFFSEFELEHSVAGEGKNGEIELEQALIQWDFTSGHSLVLGQFLVPVGIINETHEPDTFYGVERNAVENKILPATWWETGIMAQGELGAGFSYNLAVHSGLNLDTVSNDAKEVIGLEAIRSGRQKSSEASAEDLAYTGRIKFTGVKGLELGLTYQHQQDMGQGTTGEDNSADLVAVHGIYNVAGFAVRALWTEWEIDGEIPAASGQDQQEGYYLEGSYKVLADLGVFLRFEEYDQTAGDASNSEVERVVSGVNYWLAETVVLKFDYIDEDKQPSGGSDSLNLGIGWSF